MLDKNIFARKIKELETFKNEACPEDVLLKTWERMKDFSDENFTKYMDGVVDALIVSKFRELSLEGKRNFFALLKVLNSQYPNG